MPGMVYGDITPRTAAYAPKELLKRGLPLLVLEKFMQGKTLPGNSTKSMNWRRYNSLPIVPAANIVEGVTPTAQKLTVTDVSITLSQMGGLTELTDVIQDTHEDPVLKEMTVIVGEQIAQSVETLRYGVLKATTNKFYANGAVRTDVNTAIASAIQKKIIRALKRQNAMKITNIIKSTPSFNTESVLPCYVGITHTDMENDIRGMTGFIDAKDYGNTTPMEGEIGAVGDVRYMISNIFTSYPDAGAAKGAMVSTSGTDADVYPILYLGRDAWAGVALKGAFAVTPTVINPSTKDKSDPLGQRGYVGWLTMQGAVILNDLWMACLESAATDL